MMNFFEKVIETGGGVMTLQDLASHSTTPVTSISYSYGGKEGVTLHECPPNGQGITALIALGILDVLQEQGVVDLATADHNGVVWLHTLMFVLSFPPPLFFFRSRVGRS